MDFMYAYLGACGCTESARLYDRIQAAIVLSIIGFALFVYASTHFQSAMDRAVAYYCPTAEITAVTPATKHASAHSKLPSKKSGTKIHHRNG